MSADFKKLISNVRDAMAVEAGCQRAYLDAEAAAVRAREAMDRCQARLREATLATQPARGRLNMAIDEALTTAPATPHRWKRAPGAPVEWCDRCKKVEREKRGKDGSYMYRKPLGRCDTPWDSGPEPECEPDETNSGPEPKVGHVHEFEPAMGGIYECTIDDCRVQRSAPWPPDVVGQPYGPSRYRINAKSPWTKECPP